MDGATANRLEELRNETDQAIQEHKPRVRVENLTKYPSARFRAIGKRIKTDEARRAVVSRDGGYERAKHHRTVPFSSTLIAHLVAETSIDDRSRTSLISVETTLRRANEPQDSEPVFTEKVIARDLDIHSAERERVKEALSSMEETLDYADAYAMRNIAYAEPV
jgi:hypothetical protein